MWLNLINMLIANPEIFESKILLLLSYIKLQMYPNTTEMCSLVTMCFICFKKVRMWLETKKFN